MILEQNNYLDVLGNALTKKVPLSIFGSGRIFGPNLVDEVLKGPKNGQLKKKKLLIIDKFAISSCIVGQSGQIRMSYGMGSVVINEKSGDQLKFWIW